MPQRPSRRRGGSGMDSGPVSAVLDTNILVSGTIVPAGAPAAALDAWRRGAFLLLTSDEQLDELARTLRRPRFAEKYGVTEDVIARLRQSAHLLAPLAPLPLTVRDRDDERILAIALGGGAAYLVSGDDDLLSLAGDTRLGTLRIVTVRDFLVLLDR